MLPRVTRTSGLPRSHALWRLAIALACLVLVHLIGRGVLAASIALAPNAAGGRKVVPMPTPLSERHAKSAMFVVGAEPVELAAWIVEPAAREPSGTIVLLHGLRLDKASLAGVAGALVDAGYRAILVDLRGHGESTGRYLGYGSSEARDVSELLDALSRRGTRLGRVGVYGYSYGAAVALELSAIDPRVVAVVALAPFSSLREAARDYRRKYLPRALDLIPDAWWQGAVDEAAELGSFDPNRAGPLADIGRSSARLLFIHGARDTQVPLRHSRALAASANGRPELRIVPTATHETLLADADGASRRAALAWFAHWLPRSAP